MKDFSLVEMHYLEQIIFGPKGRCAVTLKLCGKDLKLTGDSNRKAHRDPGPASTVDSFITHTLHPLLPPLGISDVPQYGLCWRELTIVA